MLTLSCVVVTIAEPEAISPLLAPLDETHITHGRTQHTKQRRASITKRLSGRASVNSSPGGSPYLGPTSHDAPNDSGGASGKSYQDLHGSLVAQVIEWLHEEKRKYKNVPATKNSGPVSSMAQWTKELRASPAPIAEDSTKGIDTNLALDKLEKIISDSAALAARISRHSFSSHRPHTPRKKSSSSSKRPRGASLGAPSSDTEYHDGDALIPSADVVLDNSKTLGYFGGAASDVPELTRTVSGKSSKSVKEDNWISFKNEIIKLAHTLRLKGWKHVPLNSGAEVDVRRLSGALTNAVYVVSPPKHIAEAPLGADAQNSSNIKRRPRYALCEKD